MYLLLLLHSVSLFHCSECHVLLLGTVRDSFKKMLGAKLDANVICEPFIDEEK